MQVINYNPNNDAGWLFGNLLGKVAGTMYKDREARGASKLAEQQAINDRIGTLNNTRGLLSGYLDRDADLTDEDKTLINNRLLNAHYQGPLANNKEDLRGLLESLDLGIQGLSNFKDYNEGRQLGGKHDYLNAKEYYQQLPEGFISKFSYL